MYCIHCGAEIKAEDVNCPYCGKALQMVPDYSIYDEDDINVILENTIDVQPAMKTKEESISQKQSRKPAKKMNTKSIIILAIVLCVILLGVGIGIKLFVDYQNDHSYEYQMKAGDEAFFKDKFDVAESYYLQALSLSPNDIKVRLKLADVYFEKGTVEDGILLLNEVIALDATNFDAYKKLFELYESQGNTDAILSLKENVTDTKILKLFEDYLVKPPTINIDSGTYSDALKIMLTADKGVQIFYTIDGTNPITHGILYTDTIVISKSGMNTECIATKALSAGPGRTTLMMLRKQRIVLNAENVRKSVPSQYISAMTLKHFRRLLMSSAINFMIIKVPGISHRPGTFYIWY